MSTKITVKAPSHRSRQAVRELLGLEPGSRSSVMSRPCNVRSGAGLTVKRPSRASSSKSLSGTPVKVRPTDEIMNEPVAW